MVSKEQFVNGIIAYADNEVMPNLPIGSRWSVGACIVLATTKVNQMIDTLSDNVFIKSLGVVDNEGMIDDQRLHLAFKTSSEQYGSMTLKIPVIGALTFTSEDVDKLYEYVSGGSKECLVKNS